MAACRVPILDTVIGGTVFEDHHPVIAIAPGDHSVDAEKTTLDGDLAASFIVGACQQGRAYREPE